VRLTTVVPTALAIILLAPPSSAEGVAAGQEPAAWICPPCGCDSDGKEFAEQATCPDCGMVLVPKGEARRVGILLYPGVELLDFAGPGEVFAAATGVFTVVTVAATKDPVVSQGFVTIVPEHSLEDCPDLDILVVPGGHVTSWTENEAAMRWFADAASRAEIVMSVCTGAFVLGQAGLLDGRKATTHQGSIAALRRRVPKAEVVEDVRFVDTGKVLTTAGVSAGIDGALHLLERLAGRAKAEETARYMQYEAWAPGTETEVSRRD